MTKAELHYRIRFVLQAFGKVTSIIEKHWQPFSELDGLTMGECQLIISH